MYLGGWLEYGQLSMLDDKGGAVCLATRATPPGKQKILFRRAGKLLMRVDYPGSSFEEGSCNRSPRYTFKQW